MYRHDDWNSSSSLELWNKGNTATTVNNNKVYKTIYSPSPSTFVEPKSAAFSSFTTTGTTSTSSAQYNISGIWQTGYNFYSYPSFSGSTIFFYGLGDRSWSGLVIQSVNSNGGGIYTSGCSSLSSAYYLYYRPTDVSPSYSGGKAFAFNMRSVSE